jgi:hypothetical protein
LQGAGYGLDNIESSAPIMMTIRLTPKGREVAGLVFSEE